MKVHVNKILWDLDDDDVDVDLPNEVTLDVAGSDPGYEICDYLSDQYGFTIIALNYDIVG